MDTDKIKSIKRQSGKKDAWVWSILTTTWIAIGVTCMLKYGIERGMMALWLLGLSFGCLACSLSVRGNEHVRTIGFKIYEYDKWNKDKQVYAKRYVVDHVTLRAKFVFHYFIESYVNERTVEQIESDTKNEYLFNGHRTKDEAMLYIIDYVRTMILSDKRNENAEYKDFVMSEMLTIESIKEKLEAGEYDEILNKKTE